MVLGWKSPQVSVRGSRAVRLGIRELLSGIRGYLESVVGRTKESTSWLMWSQIAEESRFYKSV